MTLTKGESAEPVRPQDGREGAGNAGVPQRGRVGGQRGWEGGGDKKLSRGRGGGGGTWAPVVCPVESGQHPRGRLPPPGMGDPGFSGGRRLHRTPSP